MTSLLPVLDASQAAAWDERARAAGKIPSRVLMESAGRAVAAVVARELGAALRQGVLLAAGPGNNGGDGWVAARALAATGVRVLAVEVGTRRSTDCAANRALALASGVELLEPDGEWPAPGGVIDALLGTGAAGAPRGAVGTLAARVMRLGPPVLAVDGPTGLDLTTGQPHGPVRAAVTVTFGGARRGHLLAREWCGKLVVVDIGFPAPDPAWPALADDGWARAVAPPFHSAMHKGDRGRVLVVGGDEGMVGAAIHAARAALAGGAGLVKLAGSAEAVRAAHESLPDALTVVSALGPQVEPALAEAVSWADALIVGPGLGRSEPRRQLVARLLADLKQPVVLDADALHAGVGRAKISRGPRVLTPHPGEFAAAFGDLADLGRSDRFAAAEAAAAGANAVVLLKGVPTVIGAPRRASLVVAAGNPALATGGSGDVLAGLIGAFLARGLEPQAAAALGAQAMGRAAELAAAQHSARATRPADVLAALPTLWRRWSEEPRPPVPPVLLELEPPQLT